MLQRAWMSGFPEVAKNVSKSNWVLLRVCVTKFSNDIGEPVVSDKNGRFRELSATEVVKAQPLEPLTRGQRRRSRLRDTLRG